MKVRLCRSGVQLFDRRTGLNLLVDEASVHPNRWARAPRYVSFALTNTCDLSCPFCYAPKAKAALDSARLLRWLDELDNEGCLGVGFGGGEPLLYPGFAELCRAAATRTQLAITFTTHGHRLTPRLIDELRGSVHFLRVSMDGVSSTYEHLRGARFDRFLKQLDLAGQIAPFGINTVVNEQTIGELDAVAEIAAKAGATELLLLPEQPTRYRPGLDATTERAMNNWISTTPRRVRLAISELGAADTMPIADPFPSEHPLEKHAHVDARGFVKQDAYSPLGIAAQDSILFTLNELRREVVG